MSSSASVPNASKSVRGNNNCDRLSSLCDELLHHMMSFLPMPEVVRTSLLSPRWRNLWASTPFIHIDYQDFMAKNDPWRVDVDKMDKFGDHLLLLCNATVSLDEARIFVAVGSSWKSSLWIRHAIKHKVRLLHVSGFSQCPTLDRTAMCPSQHLKIVRLQSMSFSHGFFRPLNNDCPVLEHLELVNCSLYGVNEISSRSLKDLRMIGCNNIDGLPICSRNLTLLSILGPMCSGAIVMRDLSSLVAASASVILSSEEFHCYSDTIVDGHHLLDGLSHATTLELHAPLHELAFERGLQTCPVFNNLTSLVLGDWCMAADFYPLLQILQRSSKLKELILKLKMEECSVCKDSEYAVSSSGGTLSGAGSHPCLERIKICCRKDDPRIGALVQALLRIINPDGKISIERC